MCPGGGQAHAIVQSVMQEWRGYSGITRCGRWYWTTQGGRCRQMRTEGMHICAPIFLVRHLLPRTRTAGTEHPMAKTKAPPLRHALGSMNIRGHLLRGPISNRLAHCQGIRLTAWSFSCGAPSSMSRVCAPRSMPCSTPCPPSRLHARKSEVPLWRVSRDFFSAAVITLSIQHLDRPGKLSTP